MSERAQQILTDTERQKFNEMRRFFLVRHDDETGISGEGLIACGVAFPQPNGRVILGWLTEINSVAVYDSVDQLMSLHGHDGKTEIVFPALLGDMEDNGILDDDD